MNFKSGDWVEWGYAPSGRFDEWIPFGGRWCIDRVTDSGGLFFVGPHNHPSGRPWDADMFVSSAQILGVSGSLPRVCECGADKCGSPAHSSWCAKAERA